MFLQRGPQFTKADVMGLMAGCCLSFLLVENAGDVELLRFGCPPHDLQQDFFPVHYSGVTITFPLYSGDFTR